SRKIFKDLRALLRGDVQAVVGHVIEHPVPALARAPHRAVEVAERMAAGTRRDDELPVRPLRHAWVVLLGGCRFTTQQDGADAEQRRFHCGTPFLKHDDRGADHGGSAASRQASRSAWDRSNREHSLLYRMLARITWVMRQPSLVA